MPYSYITVPICINHCFMSACMACYYTITILALASLFNPFIALVSASSVIGALCILLFAPIDYTAFLAFSSSKYTKHL